ncbi:MAG: hypothetical protein U1E65_24800 [Myxococcota bacterium]
MPGENGAKSQRPLSPFLLVGEDGRLDRFALERIEGELVERADFLRLRSLYEEAQIVAPDADLGRELLLKAGFLSLDRLSDPPAAEGFFRRILSHDPENVDALDGLRKVMELEGRLEEAASTLDQMIAIVPADEKVDLLVEVAEIAHGGLDQPERAVAALRYAYSLDASRLEILHRARAIYIAEGRLTEAKAVLDAEADARLVGQDVPAEVVKSFADAYRALGLRLLDTPLDHAAAEDALERARRLGDNEALSRLDDLAAFRRDWEARAKVLREQAMEARDKRKAAELYVGMAELSLAFGKDPLKADESLKRALILAPGFAPALRFIERAYAGRAAEVAGKLAAAAADVKEPSAKSRILLRAARQATLAEAQDAEKRESRQAYERVLAVDPKNAEAASFVAQLLEQAGQYAEVAALLERHLAAVEHAHQKLPVHLELGRLYAQFLGDSERGKEHFETALRISPTSYAAAMALFALYTDAADPRGILQAQRALLEHAPDLSARLQLLNEAVPVAAQAGKEDHFETLRQLYLVDPAGDRHEAALFALAKEVGKSGALAEVLARRAARTEGDRRATLFEQAGALYEAAHDMKTASEAYKKALEARPSDAKIRDTLERILRERNDPAALADMLESQLARNPGKDEAQQILAKLGSLADRDLSDPARARSAYERLLELDPKSELALLNLDDLYRRAQAYKEQVAILERREALLSPSRDQAELTLRRARILDERLLKKAEAAELYLACLESLSDEPRLIEGLYGLAKQGVDAVHIATELEPRFRDRNEPHRQLEMLKVLLDHEQDPKKAADLARRGARLLEGRLGDPEGAMDLYNKAVLAEPTDVETLDAVLRLARELGRPERAAGLFSAMLKDEGLVAAARSTVATALGTLYDTDLDRSSDAIDCFQKAVKADGSNAVAIAALERLLGKDQRFGELVDLLTPQFMAATRRQEIVELGTRLAAIADERAQDLDKAIALCRSVLERAPGEAQVLARLSDLLERRGESEKLIETLDQGRKESSDPSVQDALDVRAGDVLRTKLAQHEAALERYRRVLSRQPTAEGAILGLDALLELPAVAPAAAGILVPIYRQQKRPRELARALEIAVEATTDRAQKGALYQELATVRLEGLEQSDAAFETLRRALAAGYDGPEDRAELVRVGLLANRGAEVTDLFEGLSAQRGDDVDLLRELARLYDGAALDPAKSKRSWNRVLQKVPGDKEALRELERLHAAGDDPGALAAILLERARAVDGTGETVALLKRASALFEEAVDDLPRAVSAMEEADRANPQDRNTLVELQRLYGRLKDLPKVNAVRAREAELLDDPSEKADVLLGLAQGLVEEDRLDEAIEIYQKAFALSPERPAAKEGLEALLKTRVSLTAAAALEPIYRRTADFGKLVEIYERLLEASTDPDERVERLLAIRSLWEERLDRPDRAFQAAARALREAPASEDVLSALERIARSQESYDELIAVLEDQADQLPRGSEPRTGLRVRAARFLESIRAPRPNVIQAYAKVLAEAPRSPDALDALARIALDAGDFDRAVTALETLADVLEDPKKRVEKLRLATRVLEAQAGDPARLTRIYERLLELAPGQSDVLSRLDTLYAQTGRFQDLEHLLSNALIKAPDGKDKELLRLRLGRLFLDRLKDPETALAHFADVLAVQGAGVAELEKGAVEGLEAVMERERAGRVELAARAAAVLEPYWRTTGQAVRFVEAKKTRLLAIKDPTEKKRLELEIAQVYEQVLGQPEMGFLALARAYEAVPGDPDLGIELERLSRVAETREELAELYSQALPRLEDESQVLALAFRAAQIYDKEASRFDAAIPLYERVLSVAPDDTASLDALERIFRQEKDARGLVRILSRRLELAATPMPAKKAIAEELAKILDSEIGDVEAAFAVHKARLALDPKDRAALIALAELATREQRPQEIERSMLGLLEIVERPDDRANLWLRLGKSRRELLRDPIAAVEAFEQVLAAKKAHPGAVLELTQVFKEGGAGRPRAGRALAPVFEESGAYADLITCLEAQIDSAAGPEKKAILAKMAQVYEERLGRIEHAFNYTSRALREDPADEALVMTLERLAKQNGMFEDLAAFYLDEVDQALDLELAVKFRRRVAEIYENELKDPSRAITEHTKILELAPGDPGTLQALERLYRQSGSFQSLAEVYRRRIAQAEDPNARVQLMRELARVQSEFLNEVPAAITTLRRLLEIAPEDLSAMERLIQLCQKENRTAELAEVYERFIPTIEKAGKTGDPARYELARLRLERLDDRAGALMLLREILERDPRSPRAREYVKERLEESVAEDDARGALECAEILAEAYRRANEAQGLIEVLRVKASLVADPESKVELSREIALLYRDQLAQPELAFTALTQALREAPDREDLRQDLEKLAEQLLLLEDLVEVYASVLDRIRDPEARLNLERRIADLYETKVGDREKAAATWEQVLKRRPMDPDALQALDRLNGALGRWGGLSDVLEKRVELAESDDEQSFELYCRLGALWEERMSEPEEALAWYKKARALKPREPKVLRALARLIDKDQAPEDLHAVLEQLADRTQDGRELVEILPRLAELASDNFGRRGEAIDLHKKVLELDPVHPKSTAELERLYELEERWTELAEQLDKQLRAAKDDKEVTRLQRKLGFVRGTRLGSVDEAVQSWNQLLRRNPSDVEALEALRKIFRGAARFDDLVAILRKLIPLQTDAEGVKGIRFELAEVFLQNLNRREEAIEAAKRVLDVEPHTMADLLRLEEIFVGAQAFHDAVRVMNLRAELSDDPGEKADILFHVASIYESKLQRRAGAAGAYERIIEIEPQNAKAYDALAAIYETAGDYQKLKDLHSRRLDNTTEPEERRRLLFAMIDILERRLGRTDLAFASACRAFAEEGADPKAQELAERLAEETQSWDVLVEVFSEQADAVALPRAIELRKRLAEIYREKLDDSKEAERQLDLVISVRPDDDGARAAMADLYRAEHRWRDLINLALDRAELTSDLAAKKEHYRTIAEVEEKQLDDVEAAIRMHRRVLEIDQGDPAPLDEIIRLHRVAGDDRALVAALEEKADRQSEPAARAAIRAEIAELWRTKIGDQNRAIEAFRDVLLIDPAHTKALTALEELFSKARRFDDLLEVFERQVQLANSPDRAVDFLLRIARIEDEEFQEQRRAHATLERALTLLPQNLPTLEDMEQILRRLAEWPRLAEIYQQHLGLLDDRERERQIELLLALGEVQEQYLDQGEAAERTYLSALSKDPAGREAVHRLGDLYEKQGSWFNALEMLQKEARLVGSGAEAVELHYRIGKINQDMLMDRPAAKLALRRAIDLDQGYLPALRALADLHRDEGRWEEVLALETQEAAHTENKNARADSYQRAAETALEKLERVDEATRLYEKSREATPDHIPSVRALGDLYFVAEDWERAEEMLEILATRLDRQTDKEELCRQLYRLAYISEKLGDDEHALKRYLASYELDSTYLPTLEGLAAALLRSERWQDAQRIYQTILVHHRDSLTDAEVVDLYYQLGDLAVRLDDVDRGRRSFDKALELDPNHPATLRAFAALSERLGEWEEAYDHRARLIDLLEDDERFEALMLQARLCRNSIADPYRAVDALTEARRIRPDNPEVLRQLGALYQETSQNGRAIDALTDLSRVAETAVERRDVALELAKVHEAQDDLTRAIESLNTALDADPACFQAFERIETLLAHAQKWNLLEENYRRMIERIPKEGDRKMARVVLWRSLGDLYRMKLKNFDGAKVAYEVVLKLKPDEQAVAITLAQLLSSRRETAPEALRIFHSLVPEAPDPAVPIRELYGLYEPLGMYDRVLCCLGALTLMRVAAPAETKLYEVLYKQSEEQKAATKGNQKALDDKLWRGIVFHQDCRNSIADILSVIFRGAPDLFAAQQKNLELKKKERVDLAAKGRGSRSELMYFNMWRQLAAAMQVGDMEHFHRPGSPQAPRMYPGFPNVLFAGEQHEVFSQLPPKQVTWVLARQMATARPELAPVRALLPEEVGAAIEGAIRLWVRDGSGIDIGLDGRVVENWTRALNVALGERAKMALKQPVTTCVQRGELKGLAKYLEGAEHTASRVALLMTNDIRVADRALGDPDGLVDMSYRRRARELMLFTLSDDYFALRQQFGLALARKT